MKKKTFKSELLSGHKDHAIEVPFNPAEMWSLTAQPLWRGRRGYQVQGKLNGLPFESSIVGRQKRFYMLVDKELMKSARLSVGDTVTATVSPQTT